MPNPTPADVGWSLPAETVRAALGAGPQGLSGAEAAMRLAHHGANVVAEEPEHAVWLLFRHQLASPLVLILIAGARPRSRRRRSTSPPAMRCAPAAASSSPARHSREYRGEGSTECSRPAPRYHRRPGPASRARGLPSTKGASTGE
ncbi:MAG: hypothetical protein IPI27_09420 [Betaproteobacteria bacterium]|nr:hypothetical protein [Betaproteobacteria bacterium]